MSIFKDHALNYLQQGYNVIPDKAKSKIPAILGWNEFSKKRPSLEEINQWCEIKDSNISIMFGELSGIVGLDLDTNDENILSQISHLLPASPVERIGSKGYVRFFKYSGEVSQEVFENYVDPIDNVSKKRVILELLSTGKKCTIPPSIHPSGKVYTWTNQPLLEIDKESLPILPSNLLNIIAEKLKLQQNSFIDSYKVSSGRNSSLGKYCAELISQQNDIESSVTKLIEFDKTTNNDPLFSDGNEFKTSLSVINAGKFYFNYLESINIKRKKENLLPELPVKLLQNDIKVVESLLNNKVKDLPKVNGILKQLVDYILARSYVEQPTLSLASSLVTLGTLISRKMVFQGVTPNLYILNIAESGSGKDSVQQAAKTLLKAAKMQNLIGASQYPSEASIIAFLAQQPVRLDIIDEASSFLKAASSGGAPYQSGIGDTLCELYTSANEHYLGKVLAAEGGKRVGQCYRPHLNILCSTTFRGISEGISHSTLEKGLFARFLTFFGDDSKPAKRIKSPVFIPEDLKRKLEYWGAWQNPKATGNIAENRPPYDIGIDKEADDLLDSYFNKLDDIKCKTTKDTVSKPIVARLYQQMLKIIMLSAVSNTDEGKLPKVTIQDVEFGYELIQFFYSQINEFIENTLHDNDRSRNVNKILYLIKKSGKEGISNIDLLKQSKSIRPQERQEIVRDLYETQMITKKESIINNTVIHMFYYIGDK